MKAQRRRTDTEEKRSRLVLMDGKVVTPFRVIPRGGVVVEGRTIAGVFSMDQPGARDVARGGEIVYVEGRVIAPGFVDIHVHGGGGADIMDDDPDAVLTIGRTHARGGSTAILPSTVASPMDGVFRVLDNLKRVRQDYPAMTGYGGATILGVHLEGPYLSPEQAGAQDPRYLRRPEREEYLAILSHSSDIVRVSAAPEVDGALELASELRSRRILASIAHSNATYDEVLQGLEAGYTHVTHLYSAMSGVRRVNAYRVAGVIESALLLDDLTVEIIADGRHLPGSLIALAYRCKGADRVALTTDAMRAAGMPEGEYYVGSPGDGQVVIVEDGVAKLPDRSAFAGSVATMNLLVRNAMHLAQIPLCDAVKMATWTPARIIDIHHAKGSIATGKDADLVVFDEEDATVSMTVVEGQIVYSRPGLCPTGALV